MARVTLVIPTLNGGALFKKLVKSIKLQTFKDITTLIIDSSSDDETVSISLENGYKVISIKREDFNHGATRQLGVELAKESEIIIFMTQDAVLATPTSLENIINCFEDSGVGAAYGRQLPRCGSDPIESHARFFNYPSQSNVKTIHDAKIFGIKTAFISNSFAAYRRSALQSIGGFPTDVILGEDTYVAAKMLLNNWTIFYCSEAEVYHSHSYNYVQEFQRYFDIGVFHSRQPWLRQNFGYAEGEGIRFVKSEFKYLWNEKRIKAIFSAFVRTFIKLSGYKLGINEGILPKNLKSKFSMHTRYWLIR